MKTRTGNGTLKQSTIVKVLFVAATMLVCAYEGWNLWGTWGLAAAIPIGILASLGVKTFAP